MARELLASGEDVNEVNPWDWIPDGETEYVGDTYYMGSVIAMAILTTDWVTSIGVPVAEACGCM